MNGDVDKISKEYAAVARELRIKPDVLGKIVYLSSQGLSKNAIAERLGLTYQTVSFCQQKIRRLSVDKFVKILLWVLISLKVIDWLSGLSLEKKEKK